MSSTANPRHPNNPPSNPPAEPTGPVVKDSLANESIQSGGGFSENPNPEILGVKGGSSTLANTDTSSAKTLPAASSGTTRDGDPSTKYPDAGATLEASYTSETAPSYTANSGTAADLKPKGKNLTEDDTLPPSNRIYTGDIGGRKDPGRLAEAEFARSSADASGGLGAREYGNVAKKGDGTQYDALKNNESA